MARLKKGAIILVGVAEKTNAVAETLKPLSATLIQSEQSVGALDKVDANTMAVVLAAPLPKAPVWRACRLFRNSLQMGGHPVFATVPDGYEQNRVRRLYREGALAVFEWPREKDDMAQLMASMMQLERLPGRG
jgi:hypothetical protein